MWVSALPEETIRHHILNHMIERLGYPPSLIVVEKALRQLPHLSVNDRQQVPDRRADIICFAKGVNGQHDLYPLIAIECKAIPLVPRMIKQIIGYNHFVRACFIALANASEIRTGWYDPTKGDYQFIPYLPSYDSLTRIVLKS